MRRITLWLLSTVALVVLLFGYRTSTGGATSVAAPAQTPVGGTSYPGSTAATRWGDVRVGITVLNGKIVDVTVPVYPTGNHKDQEINARALPVLRKQTLAAQSADIDGVSGATVTSDGYRESLQAALDAAHL
jgi:uncharacterized protein with FMN-binding domain